MKVLHLPSSQQAEVLGRHHGRKAHIVRLDNGITQLWCEHSTQLLGNDDMTKKIMMTISGTKGKYFDVIDRIFDTVEDAKIYLDELLRLNDIKTVSKEGTHATLSNGWTVASNYNIKEIIKAKAPKEDLNESFPFDLRKTMKQFTMPTKSSNLNDTPGELPLGVIPQKIKSTGKMIQLKDITKDARKARAVLRQLVRQKKIVKPSRWEWADGSAELAIVKQALSKA